MGKLSFSSTPTILDEFSISYQFVRFTRNQKKKNNSFSVHTDQLQNQWETIFELENKVQKLKKKIKKLKK